MIVLSKWLKVVVKLKMAVIYKISNKISKKVYIGETKEKNPLIRWKRHIETIKKGKGSPALRNAVKKYGIENFEFKILFFCFDKNRFHHEIETIKKYNSVVPNGYNILKGGFDGKKHTPETIEKIKKSNKRKK